MFEPAGRKEEVAKITDEMKKIQKEMVLCDGDWTSDTIADWNKRAKEYNCSAEKAGIKKAYWIIIRDSCGRAIQQ